MKNNITPEEIQDEVNTLSNKQPRKNVSFVLKQLLSQIEPVDFMAVVHEEYPDLSKKLSATTDQKKRNEVHEKISSFKLLQKHYLVISIEKLLEVAKENDWDLCKRYSNYYVYNGEYWRIIDEDQLKIFLSKVAVKMGVPKFDNQYYKFREKLSLQFESSAHLPEPEIPNDTVLINLRNGTFEITPEKQKLRDFRTKDFLTYQLPFAYHPEALAPIFDKYLSEVLPDPASQRVLAEFMGYIFLRDLKLEKVLFLYGSGRNGKSVMFEIIRAMLGDGNISYYGLSSLTDEKGYHRAKLVNKLINWASDVGQKLESNTFKQLASGEPIECRHPYKEPFTLQNVCKFAFNTNTLPDEVEYTDAFFERFLIVPFDQYIEPEKRDPKLAEKIISNELPGVFNWVLEGLNRLLRQGKFSECKASDDALREFRKDSDSVALFVDQLNYKPSTDNWTKEKPIYDDYRQFCYSEGLNPEKRKTFRKRLQNSGYISGVKDVGRVLFMRKEVVNGRN